MKLVGWCFGIGFGAVLGIMAGYEKVISTFAEYGQKLQDVTEKICKEKIESFV